jgi:ferric-dicitrate binding protein FerR (iron transport regulator)
MSELGPEETREMLRGLRDEKPDPEYRERVRRSFVSGGVSLERAGTAAALGGRGAHQERWRARLVVWLALAATIAPGVWLGNANMGPHWVLHRVTDVGQVLLDGRPLNQERDLGVRLRPGALLTTSGDAEADLACGDLAVLRVPSGTELAVPTPLGRWFRRSSTCELRRGEARVATTSHFVGAKLSIRTNLAVIEVTGTTLAVFAGQDSTCLCVLEGSATMIDRGGTRSSVAAGNRVTLFQDARAPRREAILPMERMKLQMMRDDAAAITDR